MDEPAVELTGVSYAYPGAGAALRGVSLRVERAERLGVLGPNGGGKTTLLKLILGLIEPDEGRVRVLGLAAREAVRAGLVGALPQRIEASREWPVSVRGAVTMAVEAGLAPWRRVGRGARAGVDRTLELVGISELADRPVGRLSGGQVQLTMIARAVVRRPRLLVLDEPTVGVDVAGQRRFGELIARLHAELGLAVVTVSHEVSTIAATADRVACLRQTLHYHDTPGGLTPQVLAEVFSHDVEAAFGAVHVDAHEASSCRDPAHRHGAAPGGGA